MDNDPLLLDLDITTMDSSSLLFDRGFTWLVRAFAACTVLVLFWMAWVILRSAIPAIQEFGLGFLWNQDWDIGGLVFGGLPYIYGTLVTSVMAILLAVPIGLAVALLTSENFLPRWIRSPLAFLVELIAAIPSVIIGLWGIFVLIPILDPLQFWLFDHLSWIPFFSTPPYGPGMFVAGIILAIMILPTMAAISRDVLLALPTELRSASRALGATQWETLFRVTLPMASSGVLGAITLALGRALGETMAVTMVIGNSPIVSLSLLNLGYTIPAVLANEFGEALDELHIASLMYLALILFILTLLVNIAATVVVQRLGRVQPISTL
ncbi:phosphate ABC transporter permease subunit PstC [filamentous cyanobacterium CCP1]|nr:phosphate ABC transporter permease subunit PstC [filamentous cyanobacterium CCP2]PSB60177.1 phosphate ABC transporter permease subunit PstC [filamentous cyanobacterium CCP1]